MFINKLSQNYKPRRVLYYREATPEDIDILLDGRISEDMLLYVNAFGTYDHPGIYYLDGSESGVVGVEYRLEDDRIDYPKGLKTVILEEAMFYQVEIENEIEINLPSVRSLFQKLAKDDDAHRICTHLRMRENPGVISVYMS